jgi:hypothetical protein
MKVILRLKKFTEENRPQEGMQVYWTMQEYFKNYARIDTLIFAKIVQTGLTKSGWRGKFSNGDIVRLSELRRIVAEKDTCGYTLLDPELPLINSDWQIVIDKNLIDREVDAIEVVSNGIDMVSIVDNLKQPSQSIKIIPPVR